jgi:hypothetical protein
MNPLDRYKTLIRFRLLKQFVRLLVLFVYKWSIFQPLLVFGVAPFHFARVECFLNFGDSMFNLIEFGIEFVDVALETNLDG